MDTPGITQAVSKLDMWFETMRTVGGYGGPVAHWWQNCLQFTGAGLDWRYEGIIIGYLNLYRKTGDERWLTKARRAGDDLVHGQLPSGNYRNSSFELNPYTGGTPHEAACDLALVSLARFLQDRGIPAWQVYADAAGRNLRGYYIRRLWDASARLFRDDLSEQFFVPNKAATLVEGLLDYAKLTGDESLAEVYALPTLNAILDHQVGGGPLDGAIYQCSQNRKFVGKFFPYYVARCVAGLVAGYEWWGNERYLDAALRAMDFSMKWRMEDGSFPQVVYSNLHVNRYPQWIAAIGDMLRVVELLKPYGFDIDSESTREWLLRGQSPTGGFHTAHGFAVQISQRAPDVLPEFRDLLPVAGWNDKAFRYLTSLLPENGLVGSAQIEATEVACEVRGRRRVFFESDAEMVLKAESGTVYRWQKGLPWASSGSLEVMWK